MLPARRNRYTHPYQQRGRTIRPRLSFEDHDAMKDYTFPDGTHLSDIRRIFPDAAIETMFAPDGGGGIEYAKIVFPPQPLPDR